MNKKNNIIIFNPDQMRKDALSHFGNTVNVTPNLDKLVNDNEAISFSNAFCQNPVCTPSRCSFMTGWYPYTRGHRTLFYMLQEDEPCLLRELKQNGYNVYWYGKNDLIPGENNILDYCSEYYEGVGEKVAENKFLNKNMNFDKARGDRNSIEFYSFYVGENQFDHIDRTICDIHGKLTEYGASIIPINDVITFNNKKYLKFKDNEWEEFDKAISLIKNYDEKVDKPFCLYLPFRLPHPPYAVEEPFISMVDVKSVAHPVKPYGENEIIPSILRGIYENQHLKDYGEDRFIKLKRTYLGMCARIDYQVGLLIEALKDKGIYDDTALFFFSDHGDYTGDYGLVEKNQNTFNDCLVNVPLIIKPPKEYAVKNSISDTIVELIDFTETVYDIVGVNPNYTRFGNSLLPIIEGKKSENKKYALSYGGRLYGEKQASELTACSLDMPYMPRLSLQIRDDKPYHTKAIMIRDKENKYIYRLYEEDEFYDLKCDIKEEHNEINNVKYEVKINELKSKLLDRIIETFDYVPNIINQRFSKNAKE